MFSHKTSSVYGLERAGCRRRLTLATPGGKSGLLGRTPLEVGCARGRSQLEEGKPEEAGWAIVGI
ncbi:MAG: hypothetical protein M3498_17110 [Deinococcota bacterium]|nr:hypothetical protein [Deinococcota bacterium]